MTRNNDIAILIDSGTDVPQEIKAKYKMYVIPLRIIYQDCEYIDGVSINAQEVYERFSTEIPKTSLPIGRDIVGILEKIKADGYKQVLAITISSGLSGTNNFLKQLANDVDGLEVFVFDTKNISIGSGFFAMQAATYLVEGLKMAEILDNLEKSLPFSRVFFTVATLEYLKRGGRIGLVGATVGELLNIKPIISCNEAGVYYTTGKARGRKKSIQKLIETAMAFAQTGKRYNVSVLHGNVPEELEQLKLAMLDNSKNMNEIYAGQISAALGVHTGHEILGIGIQIIE
ncbi:MAG: DegV family protein [Culicoidibacterales bacterium]